METIKKERKKIVRLDLAYLQNYCKENGVQLMEDYSGKNVIGSDRIKMKCIYENCEEQFDKTFRQMVNTGAYCLKCKEIIKDQRSREACLKKYGNERVFAVKEIREKIDNTNLEKYGDTCVLKNSAVRDKIKASNLEKYGYEHSFSNPEVRKKQQATMLSRYGGKFAVLCSSLNEKRKATCMAKYGFSYSMSSPIIQSKIRNIMKAKYGHISSLGNKNVQDKVKATVLKKYGQSHIMKVFAVKEKLRNTCIKKYGFPTCLQNEKIKEKGKKSLLLKYGVDNVFKHAGIRKLAQIKSKQTCLKKYGKEFAIQSPEIFEKIIKSGYLYKEYIYPSGRVDKIQGYEHFAIDELLQKEKIGEAEIITSRSDVPKIWYKTPDGKQHRYFVDIYIPSQNRCIEVKSIWTAKLHKDIICLKHQATKDAGYLCEIWIYDKKCIKIASFK